MTHPLLTPRYKVAAPIPGKGFAHFLTGDILVQKSHPLYPDGEIYGREDEEDVCKWTTVCKDYPHLFTLMHWAEDRAADEMPEYVKITECPSSKHIGQILKSERWMFYVVWKVSLYSGYWYDAHEVLPATEAEYNDYKNQSI